MLVAHPAPERRRGGLLSGLLLLALSLQACTQAAPLAPPASDSAASPDATSLPASATPVAPAAAPPTPISTLAPYTTPDWFEGAVVYEIFVRSFADSDGNGVGDLQGIIGRLDYIEALGVNTIWLMPIYPSPSVHGYDVTDYLDVNPDYGSLDDLRSLVAAAHDRNIRVILDFVPSHLSNQNPLFEEAYRNPASVRSDWFVWTNEAHTTYAEFAGLHEMPRFNHYNPEVIDYLAGAALYWLDLDGDGDFTDGVDGFRVDNVTFPPQEFLIALRQAIKAANPEAVVLGEAWVNNPADMSGFFDHEFDALFDFPFYTLLQGSHNSNGDGLLAGKGSPVLLDSLLKEEQERFPSEGIPVRFLSNHDTNRIATELNGDPARLRLALALPAAMPDPVMVYYGEEIGMFGQKGGPPDYDNYRREPMDWYAGEAGPGQTNWFKPDDGWNVPEDGISVEEQVDDPNSLLNFYRRTLKLRAAIPTLGRGSTGELPLQVSAPGPWGYVRSLDAQTVVVLVNFSTQPCEVTVPEFPFSSEGPVDLLTDTIYPPAEAQKAYTLTLDPAAAVWLSNE